MSGTLERELALLLRAGHRLLALESFEEERALRVLERAARATERTLRTWSLASGLDGAGDAGGGLAAALAAFAAEEGPALLAVLDAHALLGDPAGVRRLRDALPGLARRRQAVALLGPTLDLPLELEREVGRATLPLPDAEELAALFDKVAARAGGAPEPELLEHAVRAALGLTGSEAVRVLKKAWLARGALDEGAVAAIVAEKERALRRTPALSFQDAREGLGAVGGLGELKRWLRERRRAFGDEARRFGLPAPRGLLLLGVQGCGKSLCAKAVAREWGFPLLRLDLAAVFGDPPRSAELMVREATAVATSLAPAVLWIDEIEKGFASSHADARGSRVFGSFLTWLAEKEAPVFVAATANDVTALPPELLRRGRFDELFFVDLPTEAERAEVLAIHLRKRGRAPEQYPLADLATQAARLSGAELEQVVASALYKAFDAGREVSDA
ncbi:MAG: AAA family ATPase, partial [Myxococcota bacterium]|nr:AAA family ATPase [Myxococcota bacterium]